ncbi:MAG: PKD domain-containing protein, partial [Chitinophagaceae bacterium]
NAIPMYCSRGASMRFTVGGQTSSFVVLSPQLSTQYGYWPPYYVKEMIKYAKANLQIDPDRIYITGLSLGGGGTWRVATDSENWDYSFDAGIAAIAPVCGTQEMNDANYCATIGANHLPVWAFHSMDDGTVGVGATQHGEIMSNTCGVTPAIKLTYYQYGGHYGAWANAYDTGHITTQVSGGGYFTASPNLYEWFLSKTRSTNSAPVYTAPVVSAGAAQAITLPLSLITLTGSGSGTNGATISSYSWTKTSGPAGGTISLPLLNTTLVTGLVQGTYVFTLTVTDNHGLTATSSVTITVNGLFNQVPVANAGSDINLTLPVNSATLDASASKDPDGYIATYKWLKLSPGPGTITNTGAARTTVTGLTQGTYDFSLAITDNNGASSYDNVTITVNAATVANQIPVANAGTDVTLTLPANSITLDASASKDPDGAIVKYRWLKLSSGPGVIQDENAVRTTITGLAAGYYEISLAVTDNSGESSYDNINITVNAAPAAPALPSFNQVPDADAGANINVTLPVNNVTLNGSASKDPDGYITGYWWTQTSGPAGAVMSSRNAVSTNVTGLVEGNYAFILEVTDNGGLKAYSGVNVTVGAGVSAPAPTPPTGTDQPIGYIKMSTGPIQACDDASSAGRIAIYSNSVANGSLIYLDAARTRLFDGGWNWYSYTPTLGGAVTAAFAVYPNGAMALMTACSGAYSPPVAAPPAAPSNLLGYIKISSGPYQACDDASTDGRIAIYGNSIANGSYLYSDAALTQKFDGGWNWFSFTPVFGGSVTQTFAIYPIGVMGLLRSCANNTRMAAPASGVISATTAEQDEATLRSLRDSAAAVSVAAKPAKLVMYPNPVQVSATIELFSAEGGVKSINLYNANGVLSAKYTWQTIKGNNVFSLKNVSGLARGLYILDIRDTNGKPNGKLKFIKM